MKSSSHHRKSLYFALIPVVGFLVLAISAAAAMVLSADHLAAVGLQPLVPTDVPTESAELRQAEIDADVGVALMRWAVLWAGTNAALLFLFGITITLIWRQTQVWKIRAPAIALPVIFAAAIATLILLTGFHFGPGMTADENAISQQARRLVKAITDPAMLLAVFVTVSAFAVITYRATEVAKDPVKEGDSTQSGAPGGQDGKPSRKELLDWFRYLTITASVTLLLGAAEVQSLFSIPVAEQPLHAHLGGVADAWGLTVGAFYSLILAALCLPSALLLRPWDRTFPAKPIRPNGSSGSKQQGDSTKGDSSAGTTSATSSGPSGFLIGLLTKIEPLLAILAPFLSSLFAAWT